MITLLTIAQLSLHLGYAVNPDAPKVEVSYQTGPVVAGIQAVVRNAREGYAYLGLTHSFTLGEWSLSPMIGAGIYHEQNPRKYWRGYGNWSTRYIGRISLTRSVGDMQIGFFTDHITNLKGPSWNHGWDLGGAGSTTGLVVKWTY